MPLPKELQTGTPIVPAVADDLSNHVTIYSNGMGHFQRVIQVPAEEGVKISIPFKKEHIADVLESLSVFGRVKYSVPPSYTPTNANDTSLMIESDDVTTSLLTALSGAKFSYRLLGEQTDWNESNNNGWHVSTLMGFETISMLLEGSSHVKVEDKLVTVMTEDGQATRLYFSEIAQYRFDEAAVQSEITKAIKHNFQKIKPDSTFLDLELASTTGKNEVATVTYKVPVAAWKVRYNIRQDAKGAFIEGAALVDNCTDEDWIDTQISVVTGNPISFYSPDLALVNVPIRQTVNIVENQSLGHVEAESGKVLAASARGGVAMRSMSASPSYRTASAASASFGMTEALEDASYSAPMAESAGVEVKEAGDFAVFTSRESVSIKAKKSAVVPMFTVGLSNASTVLLYKEASHNRRPYRAIKFINEATHDLGRGKVGIYDQGVFQGEAVIDLTKPGESRLLPFCLENGVRIIKEDKGTVNTVTKLTLAKGYSHEERRYVGTTEYAVTNKKAEPFKVMIEHVSLLPSATTPPIVEGVDVKELEKLSNGYRIYFELAPKQEFTVVVTETFIKQSEQGFFNNYNWLLSNIINPKHPLGANETVQKCLALQAEAEKVDQEITSQKQAISSLDEDATRLRANIGSVKEEAGTAATRTKWVKALDDAEEGIHNIKKKVLPGLDKRKKELQLQIVEALKAIHAEWTATA